MKAALLLVLLALPALAQPSPRVVTQGGGETGTYTGTKTINGPLIANGRARLDGGVEVNGRAEVDGGLVVKEFAVLDGGAYVNGTLWLDGGFVPNGPIWPWTANNIAAAGATQGTATAITADINILTSCTAASAEGVILPTAVVGRLIYVCTNGVSGCKVYPASGASIDANAANAPTTALGTNVCSRFTGVSTSKWVQD